jgi:hypothetical protein
MAAFKIERFHIFGWGAIWKNEVTLFLVGKAAVIQKQEFELRYGGLGQKSWDYSAFGQITGLWPCKLQAPSAT